MTITPTEPHHHATHLDQHRHTADGGPVVLDVGDDVGALVLHTTSDRVGAEIEISPIGEPDRRHHVAVHPRYLGGSQIYAAVYPDLVHGQYQLWSLTGEPVQTICIQGGHITEAHWTQ